MEHSKPAYYAVIPANVRYDSKLIPSAKLLYGEITALCNQKGFCWSTNSYFAELYNVSEKSITIWINSLIEGGYIDRKIIYKDNSKEVLARHLILKNTQPIEQKLHTYGKKGNDPMEENFYTPMEEKVRDNNTLFNNTINITNNIKSKEAEIEDFFNSLWNLYPNKKSKTKVSKESKKKIFKVGLEHMQRAILRYRKEVENVEMKYIKHGSSFFNSGYIDYLDENYTQECNLNFKFNGDDEIISNFNEYVKMKRKEYRNLLLMYNHNEVDIMIDRLNELKEKGETINKTDYDWILEKLQIESVKAI